MNLTHDLAILIGTTALQRLSEDNGGIVLYVPGPARMTADHPVARSIGLDLAMIVSNHYGPGEVSIPILTEVPGDARMRAVKAAWLAGQKPREIARRFKLSQRHVYRIIAKG